MFNLTAMLRLNDQSFSRGMRNAQRSMSTLSSGVGNLAKSLGVVTSVAVATAVAVSSVSKAMDFESQMSKVGAIAGASNSELLQLKDNAMQLGAITTKSATEVAQSMQELAAKGFDTNKIIGAMPGIIKAAEASGSDLATTSDVITSALNAFNMKASDSTHIADVLAMTANQSAAGIEDMGFAFKYAAPVAKGLGLRLEELSAATGLMVDKGLAGEQAGTSLRMGLMRLADAPKEASVAMNAMGFSAIDSAGKFKSITTITDELRKSMNGMTDAQKVSTLNTIFGAEAATGWLGLIDSAPGKMKNMTDALVNSNGTAASTSKKMLNNAAGAVELLKGSIETLQIKLGSALLPTIQEGAKAFSSWMDGIKPEQIQGWADKIKSGGQSALDFAMAIKNNWPAIRETIIGVGTAVVTFRTIMAGLAIISTVTTMMNAYRVANEAATVAQAFFNGVLLANPIGLVVIGIAALIAGIVLLVRHFGGWEGAWKAVQRTAAAALNFVIGKINDMIGLINMIPGVNIPVVAKVDWGSVKPPTGVADFRKLDSGRGHAGGLDYVPYDGYKINAHRGETLLNKSEADAYRNGKGGGNTYNITLNHNGTGSTEQDAERLFEFFVRKVEAAGREGA